MSDLTKRLRESVKMDAHNGDTMERSICGKQMLEAAGRLNALERDLEHERHERGISESGSDVRVELKNYDIAALERDNAELRRQLAEAYEGCIAAMWSVVMGNASPDTRTAFEFAEGAIRALIPTKEADHAGS